VRTEVVPAEKGIEAAVEKLSEGLPVALPTETVYGLAANALDPIACARIFEAKARPLSDPLIVHLPSPDRIDTVARIEPGIRSTVLALVDAFWPGPLTLVLPRRSAVPDVVTAGQETVAVRCSAHPAFQAVCLAFGKPLAAPSANRFGRISPTTAADTLDELTGRIPLILDGGPCAHGIESTIVHVSEAGLSILRSGPIGTEDLADFGNVIPAVTGISSPGNLKSHYAPAHRLALVDAPGAIPPEARRATALLLPQPMPDIRDFRSVEILSSSGDLREMATRLFSCLRRLDQSGAERIAAVLPPENGIGVAIAERLRKAAADE